MNNMDKIVTIIVCTHNGERFLQEQLESLAKQKWSHWSVFVYDDASTDNTANIVQQFKQEQLANDKDVTFITHAQKGFVKNFLSAMCRVPLENQFFALADQDDFWKEGKLQKAMEWLSTIDEKTPALYCSRTELVDQKLMHIGLSPLFTKTPSFTNALVQSIAGGNTMVFNRAALNLVRIAGSSVDVVSHDWWLYQLVTGAGGIVYYDKHPEILYRQHDTNLIGANTSFAARLTRIKLMLQGRFKKWNDRNIKALQGIRPYLTTENQKYLDEFATAKTRWLIPYLWGLYKAKIHRQTLLGNLGLIVAAILKKV